MLPHYTVREALSPTTRAFAEGRKLPQWATSTPGSWSKNMHC